MRALPEIFFLAIVIYILYRFFFNFVVPIARTTRQVRQQFRNMQDTAQNRQDNFQDPYGPHNGQARAPQATQQQRPPSNKAGEYIDFEEIK
jgi:lipopolysaccharide export LptBFGC system permease protein LptF